MTLVPFASSTATISPSPITEIVQEQEEDLIPSPTPFVHEVQAGDTLLSIALRYGVTLDGMLTANPGIDPSFLAIGQELRIPGPEGQPADTLLPTSTPLPLTVAGATCYPGIERVWWCLAEVENVTEFPVEGLTARVRFLNSRGEVLHSSLAYAPLNRLPVGGRLPFLASFQAENDDPIFANFSLLSAVGSELETPRYLKTQIEIQEQAALGAGDRWRIIGELMLSDEQVEAGFRVSALVMALDEAGRIVGYNKWEPDDLEAGSWQFETYVYSLGPAIDEVEILAEAVQLDE